jgi:hypothetical protein
MLQASQIDVCAIFVHHLSFTCCPVGRLISLAKVPVRRLETGKAVIRGGKAIGGHIQIKQVGVPHGAASGPVREGLDIPPRGRSTRWADQRADWNHEAI